MGALAVGLSNPFPGLRPFNEDEEYLFFGRENQIDTMVDKLARTRFLVVLGSSGSGKSSLVNCGLRPALHRGLMGTAGSAWRMAQFRPGSAPLEAMAKALAKDGVLFPGFKLQGLTLDELIESTLRLSKLGLVDIYEQARLNDGTNLLVVVDQFEELFRYRTLSTPQKTDEYGMRQETTAFVNLLLEAPKQRTCSIYVVLTMRSDFLGDCAQFPALPEAINEGHYLVPRMTRDDRRAAIGGPVAVRGAEISPVLLTRLVNDVGDDPDQLSILQHALNRTWAKWQEQDGIGPLDLKHYEAIGTMAAALDKHVEEAFAELSDHRKQKICEKIFKALTDKGTDARGIRRPTKLGTLHALCEADGTGVKEVIDVFREAQRSFLMPPASEELADDTVIDISHESLMRIWQRLDGWANEEVKSAEMYRKLRADAELYKLGQRSLWRDPELPLALNWRAENRPTEAWAELYGSGFSQAMQFLDESAKAQQRSRLWKRIQWLGITTAAFLGVIIWGCYIWQTKERLQNRVNELEQKNPELQEEVKNLREKNRSLRLESAKLQRESQWLQTTIQSTKEYHERLRNFADQLGLRNRELAEREDGLKNESSSLAAERDKLRQEEDQLTKEADRLDTENRDLRKSLLAKGFLPLVLPMVTTEAMQLPGIPKPHRYKARAFPGRPPQPTPKPGSGEVGEPQERLKDLEEQNLLFKMLGDDLRADNQRLAQEMADSSTTNKTLRAELAQLQSVENNLDQEVASLQNEAELLEGKVNQLDLENDSLQMELWSLAAKNAALVQWSNHLGGDNQIMKEALAHGRSPNAGAARSGREVGANDARPIPGELDVGEIRAALKKSLEKQNNDPDAGVYRQILADQGLDPAKIPGQTFVAKVLEAYQRYPTKRRAIYETVSRLLPSQEPVQSQTPEETIPLPPLPQ
jgi:FtsZ-binding cell division protein ZapB/guanylate kinase